MTGQNMKTLQFTEAKAKLSEILDEVERGEVIQITRHGKPVARIVRPEDDEQERRRRAIEDIRTWKRTGRKTGITIEDILSARDEGRKP
jgi:prevent-host-death family protein